jgi:hypothetical protein
MSFSSVGFSPQPLSQVPGVPPSNPGASKMARVSERAVQDRALADGWTWADVERLWPEVQGRTVSGWDAGKALEHLVVRAFALSGLRVEYPYEVPFEGRVLEQVDGMVYLGDVPFLIECKDRRVVDIEVVARLRSRLERRPPSTMGCVFSSGRFTEPAVVLANFAVPHRITLWSGEDVSEGIALRDFAAVLRRKYHELCMFGLMNQSSEFHDLKERRDDR